ALATLVLNRPHVLNCANEQWARDLNTLVDDLASHAQLRVVVVRGAGRAFCSGIDLTALSLGEIGMTFYRNWETALRKLEALVAVGAPAMTAQCLGGGLQFARACARRIARDVAGFGIPALGDGIIPGRGMGRAARHAGLGRAKRLALAADVVDAAVALEWGLVDWVVEADAFESTILELTERLLSMARAATRVTKKLTNMGCDASFSEFAETYFEYQRLSMASPEHLDAMEKHRAERAARQG